MSEGEGRVKNGPRWAVVRQQGGAGMLYLVHFRASKHPRVITHTPWPSGRAYRFITATSAYHHLLSFDQLRPCRVLNSWQGRAMVSDPLLYVGATPPPALEAAGVTSVLPPHRPWSAPSSAAAAALISAPITRRLEPVSSARSGHQAVRVDGGSPASPPWFDSPRSASVAPPIGATN